MQIRAYYATSMFVQESANTQTTKPEYTDRGLAGAANGASSPFYAHTHASSLQTNKQLLKDKIVHTQHVVPPTTQPPLSCCKVGLDIQVGLATAVSR